MWKLGGSDPIVLKNNETEIKHNWILFKVKKSQTKSDTILYAYCSLILEGIDGHG